MNRKGVALWLIMVLVLASIVVIETSTDITPKVGAITIYVDDDYGSEDALHKKTIQAALDNATPGDTVYVYSGIYTENIIINKTITLIGDNENSTIINGGGNAIIHISANCVNITGFTMTNGKNGIEIYDYNWNNVFNNTVFGMNNGYNLILRNSSGNNITGNHFFNSIIGIGLGTPGSCSNNSISNNIVSDNHYGIYLANSKDNKINGNIITNNGQGIHLGSSSNNNIITNNKISNTDYGIYLSHSSINNFILNCSIMSSTNYDFYFNEKSLATTVDSIFNKTNTYFYDSSSKLIVNWYLHINATDIFGNPIPNAIVCVKDNQNTLPAQKYITDSEGYIRWLTQTEYIEQDTNGDTIGEKTYYTPHRITAWNETLMGYVKVNINESKEINIVLDTPYYEIPLSDGWNLISLPLVQSDTSIATILSSIAGKWDVVWWYNASGGTWHSTNGDLTDINHTMGFWIHMKTPDILIVTGSIPSTTSIQLYQGWNLVGNPSFCIHSIDDILSPIATKYIAVQQYDSWDSSRDPWRHCNINKPPNLNDLAYMTNGRGYWLYVTEDCIWQIYNF